MTTLMLVGLAIAGTALTARTLVRSWNKLQKQAANIPKTPLLTAYYRGGFEPRMTRREAGLILGVSPSSQNKRILDAHKRVMLLNHPDRGGSPYLAGKINEAKDYLIKDNKSTSK